ncbi:gamma-glutamyltransferase family protein [Saccharibacillus sp. CPCC 101409]|uniref:gamma-glutamyltransferase family protein n=1 Tax=Saccharibacillus sp. CPCC 101409 TaxID=3058041 RepID=UPI0026729966|nr:gamma-glutamyltransferase family protein [Saccharibacillus sp. CPCC 101409]MDO3410446.1 gamma-glutamyltransferase family protein [Saccharibacillus sp. CPCC 101409]
MNFDPLYQPYPSRRLPVYGRNGMVATSQPLAAQAGLDILKAGGNAIDAAVATAAALTVLEPAFNGIGGDAFALVWANGELHGLNASGPAPAALSIEALLKRGIEEIPKYGTVPITVPGAPAAWAELSSRFGRLPLSQTLEPAARYAEEGYPLPASLAYFWARAHRIFGRQLIGDEYAEWFRTFAPGGCAPGAGEMWASPAHAATLREIGETRAESFYRGDLAAKIAGYIGDHGGYLTRADLAGYKPEWVRPVSASYRGYEVWEIPPNGQGLVALMALNMLDGFPAGDKESVLTYHRQFEAIKLAFADGEAYIADAAHMRASVDGLLSRKYADERRALITDEAALPGPGTPPSGGTVYLAAADGEGNMVSFIQSNYMGFGSGIVIPGTGIAMQNRGHNFSMNPEHDNALAPGKRSYHTIIPGFLTRGGEAVGPFGVMGGFMQPQAHVQVVTSTVDHLLNPQAALDAPRWMWENGRTVRVEPDFPIHIAQALMRKGHDIQVAPDKNMFGKGQIIWRDPVSGVLCGGTESRSDGTVAAW